MAGSLAYTAVLDACVLYPAPVRDLMLSLSVAGLFRARWTEDIHNEWIRNLLKQRNDLQPEALQRTRQMMDQSVPDCLITGYASFIESLELPDPNDRHVLAAAIVGHADSIVTFNRKDFPNEVVHNHGIEILHPDDFLTSQYDLDPVQTLTTVKEVRSRLKRPPLSASEYLDKLEATGLPQTSQKLREAIELI
ncbi:MAG: PIN domain-containing protein [Paraburkholderia sp.]|uniref:PIN domain-containing protein n=1 Tax=Paraburkholderia sp. TaxID=1926495 RepID=UPI00120A1D5D|nr:PIN domain-containing protein [Paraburkholderia sp.]TAM03668.1 MAG: PIN domain-containing protein [Paraburkholderia sp.]TAM31188.1 MAG: PIN domain-containing protein [Paraburkholderia sp.]